MTDQHELRTARAGLTQLIEPADALGVIATRAWGPVRLLEIIQGSTPSQTEWQAVTVEHNEQLSTKFQRRLSTALERWQRKRSYLNPQAALRYITRLHGAFLIPEDPTWPAAVRDLDVTEPLGLWTLGTTQLPQQSSMLSLVGSREATAYGRAATRMLAAKARTMGVTVLSGGAFGIDHQAHETALGTTGPNIPTVAVLAGGLDQFYPVQHTELFRHIVTHGSLISEMPPGMRPNRYRFLNRNRVIAALSAVTIVVEARYRSGALNTANHAHDLTRVVGAIPGPIDQPSSAGCHRLIKETPTLLIDDPADLEQFYSTAHSGESHTGHEAHEKIYDHMEVQELLVFEALPVRGQTSVSHLCGITGLAVPVIAGILSKFERASIAERSDRGWRKAQYPRS